MTGRLLLSRSLLQSSLCTFALMAAASVQAEATAAASTPARPAHQDTPLDSEFWELYDELADDNGRLPAPEDIPPPQDSMPNRAPTPSAALEEL